MIASLVVALAFADLAALTPPTAKDWRRAFDFDGDGVADTVDSRFTGGAHCCYFLTVRLSSGKVFEVPFEMDGGYVFGLDLSRPGNFDIRVVDGRARLFMYIARYTYTEYPIPKKWKRQYGFTSHHVIVSFAKDRMTVRDDPHPNAL
jgi:hypothetical protein